jgi:hypothetical protein
MHISHKASKIVFFCHPLLGSPNNAVLGSIPPLSLLDFALSPAPSWLLSENGRSTPPPRPREVATINPPQSIFPPSVYFVMGGAAGGPAATRAGIDDRPPLIYVSPAEDKRRRVLIFVAGFVGWPQRRKPMLMPILEVWANSGPVQSPQAVSAKSPRRICRRGRSDGAPWSDLPGGA